MCKLFFDIKNIKFKKRISGGNTTKNMKIIKVKESENLNGLNQKKWLIMICLRLKVQVLMELNLKWTIRRWVFQDIVKYSILFESNK